MPDKLKTKKNGKSKAKKQVQTIEIVDKQKMEVEIETMKGNIFKYADKIHQALTIEEKKACNQRIKQLEMSIKILEEKYEKRFGQRPDVGYNTIPNPMESITQKYPGLQYNVDDPVIRKDIGRGLSYNSGYSGYTEKEAEEIKSLLGL